MTATIVGVVVLFVLFIVFGFIPFTLGNGDYWLGVSIILVIITCLAIAWIVGNVTIWVFELI